MLNVKSTVLGVLVSLFICACASAQPSQTTVCADCYRPAAPANCSAYGTPTLTVCTSTSSKCTSFFPPIVECELRFQVTYVPSPFLQRVRLATTGEIGSDCYEVKETVCLWKQLCDCNGKQIGDQCGLDNNDTPSKGESEQLHDYIVKGDPCDGTASYPSPVPAEEDQ